MATDPRKVRSHYLVVQQRPNRPQTSHILGIVPSNYSKQKIAHEFSINPETVIDAKIVRARGMWAKRCTHYWLFITQ